MEENKLKTTKQSKGSIKLLGNILTVIIIILLALVSFVGIYVTDKNSMKNVIPEYQLGMDINGARNIVIKACAEPSFIPVLLWISIFPSLLVIWFKYTFLATS